MQSIVTYAQSSGKMKKDNRVSDVQSDKVNGENIGSVRKSEVDKVRDRLNPAPDYGQPNYDLMTCHQLSENWSFLDTARC